MAEPVHAILIHGAWQGSWVWDDFVPLVAEAGLVAHAVDLPGNGADDTPAEQASLELYVDHVGALIEVLEGKITLLAHSGAGVIASALGERYAQRLSLITYIAGMMLPSGWDFADILRQEKAQERGLMGIGPHLVWNEERTISHVPPQAGARIFLNDMPHDLALAGAEKLTPQGERGRALRTTWTQARFGQIPRLYVQCARDLSVLLPIQQAMQATVPGAVRIALDAGHAPHVSQPQVLADALLPAILAQIA